MAGPRPKKSLGQNFLSDPWWVQRDVQALRLARTDQVLEIGPGKGVLTRELLKNAGHLLAVEIDGRMVEHLKREFAGVPNLELVHGDFLEYNLSARLAGREVRILGNLPYHVTSAILLRVLDEIRRFQRDPASAARVTDFSVMIQKEVGERILAGPGSRIYGVLSVFVRVLCDCELLLEVPPEAFQPRPKVRSVVLGLRALDRPRHRIEDWNLFRRVVRGSFNQRRKMLRRSLQGIPGLPPLEELRGLPTGFLERRPEELDAGEFADLAKRFGDCMGSEGL